MVASVNVQDSDNDGLLDIWETIWIACQYAGFAGDLRDLRAVSTRTRCVNLPAMGANPKKQDIFIQADWMYSRRH